MVDTRSNSHNKDFKGLIYSRLEIGIFPIVHITTTNEPMAESTSKNYRNSIYIDGSENTKNAAENERLTMNSQTMPIHVFRLFLYNYERWLYYALKLDKQIVRKTIDHTERHFLFNHEGCLLYLRKSQEFNSELRELMKIYIPFYPGLLEAIEVELWDESDTFQPMTVTSIEQNNNSYVVNYSTPSGEPMSVSEKELGNDEIINLLSALIENNNNEMKIIPKPKSTMFTPVPIQETTNKEYIDPVNFDEVDFFAEREDVMPIDFGITDFF